MTKEAQRKGKEAEGRVLKTALGLGFGARPATPEDDYAKKLNCILKEFQFRSVVVENRTQKEKG